MTFKFPQPDPFNRKSIKMHSPVFSEGEDGVFKATIKWTLSIHISQDPYVMLPDLAASVFTDYLPIRGTRYHNQKPWVTCRTTKCEHVEGGVYTYTATYSDKNAEGEEEGTNEDPLKDRPIVKAIAGVSPLAIYKDRDDEAIMNKANDPLPESIEDNTIGFKVQANVKTADPATILGLRNTVNDAPITVGGLPLGAEVARYVLESGYIDGPKSRNDITYLVFSYTLLFDERNLHRGVPLNAGLRELKDGEQVPIIGPKGDEPSDPVPLDNNGVKIANPTPQNVKFLNFGKYNLADYSILPGVS